MKPCSKNRRAIAWLALDTLESSAARALRAHLEVCPACRRYCDELTNVREKLRPAQSASELEASTAFHRRVVVALRNEPPPRRGFAAQLEPWRRWRIAWPAALAGFALVTLAIVLLWSMRLPSAMRPTPQPVLATVGTQPPQTRPLELHALLEPEPTLANYEAIANRSLDELDDVLTRQGSRHVASAPLYTASARVTSKVEF
jgi:anti-sigma factor RsiW